MFIIQINRIIKVIITYKRNYKLIYFHFYLPYLLTDLFKHASSSISTWVPFPCVIISPSLKIYVKLWRYRKMLPCGTPHLVTKHGVPIHVSLYHFVMLFNLQASSHSNKVTIIDQRKIRRCPKRTKLHQNFKELTKDKPCGPIKSFQVPPLCTCQHVALLHNLNIVSLFIMTM